jgi:purine-binding chemotaxis protein CheW
MERSQQQVQGLSARAADGTQLLTFLLAGEEYGVDILRVQEIRGWDGATAIPNTPRYIKGIINLRGTIVPIIDLRERFNLPSIAYGPTTVVVVLKVQSGDRSRIMGIVVDAVSDVYNVSAQDLKPAPEFGGANKTEFLRGLVTVNEKMLIVLDIDQLLNSGELAFATGSN